MNQRGLEHAVRAGSEIDLPPRYGGDHDDRRRLGFLQKRHRGVDRSDSAHHVGIELGLPRRLILADRQCRTFDTTMSMPPCSMPTSPTHCVSAKPSATSTAEAWLLVRNGRTRRW